MNLSQLLKRPDRALSKLRERIMLHDGFRGLYYGILWEDGGIVYRRMLLVERPLGETIPEISPRVPIVFDQLKETEVGEYFSFRPDEDPSMVRSRLSRGHCCFVARNLGQVVHAGWANTSAANIAELAREIKLASDEIFHYDSFTSPRLRGQHVYQAYLAWLLRHFRDTGYRRLIAHVQLDNVASIRALEKVGYRSVGVMGYVKLGRWRWEFFQMKRKPLSLP